jgi:branched-subunit amino acid ABC-type transport system permease component
MQSEETTGSSTLFRIAGVGASLAFGAMVASLFALKSRPDGFAFELNAVTIVAFVAAAALGWFYWRMIARLAAESGPQPRKKKFVVFSIGLVVFGIVSFLYPLKFISKDKRKDVFIGLALAAGCVTGVGFVMMKVKKFLDADLKRSEEEDCE